VCGSFPRKASGPGTPRMMSRPAGWGRALSRWGRSLAMASMWRTDSSLRKCFVRRKAAAAPPTGPRPGPIQKCLDPVFEGGRVPVRRLESSREKRRPERLGVTRDPPFHEVVGADQVKAGFRLNDHAVVLQAMENVRSSSETDACRLGNVTNRALQELRFHQEGKDEAKTRRSHASRASRGRLSLRPSTWAT
jgi:hypothetical protein